MIRALPWILVCGLSIVTATVVVSPVANDIEEMKEQRIKLLEERLALLQELIDAGRSSGTDLANAKIEVLNAKIEYAEMADIRKELYAKMITEYDKLIDVAELHAKEPLRPGDGKADFAHSSIAEVLYLKSEKLRVQILAEQSN